MTSRHSYFCLLSLILMLCIASTRAEDSQTPYLLEPTQKKSLASDAKKISFSCWIPPASRYSIILGRIYREAFAALGYDFEMIYRPMQREIYEANQGISDGVCARDWSYLSGAPESPLLRVDVVVARTELQVWSNDPDIKIANAGELNASSLQVGYVRGSSGNEVIFSKERMATAQALIDAEVGIKMLSAGRIDLLIIIDATLQRLLPGMQLRNDIYNAGTLYSQKAYVHLHPRHRDLLPAFTEELRRRIPAGGISIE